MTTRYSLKNVASYSPVRLMYGRKTNQSNLPIVRLIAGCALWSVKYGSNEKLKRNRRANYHVWYVRINNKKNIFVILAVLHRSMERVARSISAVQRLDNTAPKQHRSGGQFRRHCVRFDRLGNRTPDLQRR